MLLIKFLVFFIWSHHIVYVSLCLSSDKEVATIEFDVGDKLNIHIKDSGATAYLLKLRIYFNDNKIDYVEKKNMPFSLQYMHNNACVIFEYYEPSNPERRCNEKVLFKLKTNRYNLRKKSKHVCLSDKGCKCIVKNEWFKKCENPEHGEGSKSTEKKEKEVELVIKDIYREKPLETGENVYEEGDKASIDCSYNKNTSYYLMWKVFRKKDGKTLNNGGLLQLIGNANRSLRISANMNVIDNYLAIQCCAYNNNNQILLTSGYYMFNIELRNKTYPYDRTIVQPKGDFFRSGSMYECGIKPYTYVKAWFEVKEDIIEKVANKTLEMSPKYDNKELYCIAYTSNIEYRTDDRTVHMVQRTLSKIKFQMSEEPEETTDRSHKILYYVGIACGFGVLTLIIFCVVQVFRKHKEEEIYATPQVQYADLDHTSRIPRNTIKTDNSPYAEIVGVLERNNI